MNVTETNSLLQHGLLCCRVCLMTDCRLYNIHEYKLADTFTRISGTPVSRDSLPQYLCAYCLVLLLKCASFRDMCLRTVKQLTPALLKGALDIDYIRKYQNPHRSLSLTKTQVEILELLPPEDLHNEQDEHSVSGDGINEAYLEIKPEIRENFIEISEVDFKDEVVFKDGILSKRNIKKNKTKENILKTLKKRKRPIIKKNKVLKIERVFNESMDFDNNVMKMKKENTETTKTPEGENMVLKTERVCNESMDFDKYLVKIEKDNTGTLKMMAIEVKGDKIELKVGEKSDYNDDIYYEEVQEKIEDVKIKRKKVHNRTRTERTKNVIKSGNIKRKLPKFISTSFESTYDLKVVTLSKEEQLEEIETRKKSQNYLESPFKCENCGKGYGVESAYNNHRVRHNPSNGPHCCDICASYFKTPNQLYQHRIQRRLKLICNACGFVSRNKEQAIKHHATHTGKTYECPHCSKIFIKNTSCFNHVRLAHPELNVDCVDCGETFVGDYGLRLHRKRIHDLNSKKFICTVCSANFNSVEALNRHTDTAAEHGDLRPCEQCGENCASEDALREHVGEMHPTESHICEVCNVAFSNAAALDTHSRRKHLGLRYAAPSAQYRGQYRGRYRRKANHPNPCMCEQCGAILPYPSLLACHMRTHLAVKPYACPHCPKKFNWPHSLKNHVRAHNSDEKPHQCPECPRAFNSKSNFNRHYNTAHLGIRGSFPCPICGRASTTKHSLSVHVRGVHGDANGQDRSKRKKKTQLDDQ
ncbi:zinc finger protein 107-like [Cydia pomonella]|uniref:zinc finger protein 107-like n=1 Tax=Cydia pomonella TaxID=82600 RepID=UPI002ADE4707|nr:zinc finger protein 107-like [Cydia pomonella]